MDLGGGGYDRQSMAAHGLVGRAQHAQEDGEGAGAGELVAALLVEGEPLDELHHERAERVGLHQ